MSTYYMTIDDCTESIEFTDKLLKEWPKECPGKRLSIHMGWKIYSRAEVIQMRDDFEKHRCFLCKRKIQDDYWGGKLSPRAMKKVEGIPGVLSPEEKALWVKRTSGGSESIRKGMTIEVD